MNARTWVQISRRVDTPGFPIARVAGTPTASGHSSVGYIPDDRGEPTLVGVIGYLTKTEEQAVRALLSLHTDGGLHYGHDQVCLHDLALGDPEHDAMCSLVALDQWAGAFQVEVRAVLAECEAREAETSRWRRDLAERCIAQCATEGGEPLADVARAFFAPALGDTGQENPGDGLLTSEAVVRRLGAQTPEAIIETRRLYSHMKVVAARVSRGR